MNHKGGLSLVCREAYETYFLYGQHKSVNGSHHGIQSIYNSCLQ